MKRKKLFSVILTLVMVVSLMPAGALAADMPYTYGAKQALTAEQPIGAASGTIGDTASEDEVLFYEYTLDEYTYTIKPNTFTVDDLPDKPVKVSKDNTRVKEDTIQWTETKAEQKKEKQHPVTPLRQVQSLYLQRPAVHWK